MRVAILHQHVPPDAPADEQDVLVQIAAVDKALRELGHETERLPCTLALDRLPRALAAFRPDVIFNLVESLDGAGRLIHLPAALFDHLRLPFTGVPTEALVTTSNKLLAKRLLAAAGVPTPPWIDHSRPRPAPGVERWILKSVWEDGSVGISPECVVSTTDADALRRQLDGLTARLGGDAFAEAYIDGREFNVALLASGPGRDPQALPPVELRFVDWAADRPRIYDYRAKWEVDSFEYTHTKRSFDASTSDAPLVEELQRLAIRCWHTFGLRGYARVDFRVDATGAPWVLEVNANPCLSPDANFFAALERAKIPFVDAIRRILADTGSASVRALNGRATRHASHERPVAARDESGPPGARRRPAFVGSSTELTTS